MTVYKLVRQKKDGSLWPLFIGKDEPYVLDKIHRARNLPTPGFAHRPGFHVCFKPEAPHLKTELASGEKRVWIECEIQNGLVERYERPESQGGAWGLTFCLIPRKILTASQVHAILNNTEEEL